LGVVFTSAASSQKAIHTIPACKFVTSSKQGLHRFSLQGMEERNGTNMEKSDEILMPGFRFHPTDEELVSFYLKRKVQQKPISIELIRQLDIYKYDPWDLPSKKTPHLLSELVLLRPSFLKFTVCSCSFINRACEHR
jgi:hypothetical protein